MHRLRHRRKATLKEQESVLLTHTRITAIIRPCSDHHRLSSCHVILAHRYVFFSISYDFFPKSPLVSPPVPCFLSVLVNFYHLSLSLNLTFYPALPGILAIPFRVLSAISFNSHSSPIRRFTVFISGLNRVRDSFFYFEEFHEWLSDDFSTYLYFYELFTYVAV